MTGRSPDDKGCLMTTDDFRHMALSLPGAEELNGLGYPNFRAGQKSFATIENSMAVIRLSRDQQATFVVAAPKGFEPVSGGWGRLGTTVIRLDVVNGATARGCTRHGLVQCRRCRQCPRSHKERRGRR